MEILWTAVAKAQLKEAVQYYKEVAGSKVANSIKTKIFEKVKRLKKNPEIGPYEQNPLITPLTYRYLVSGNYKIIYSVKKVEKIILIAAVFDARQHPDVLKV